MNIVASLRENDALLLHHKKQPLYVRPLVQQINRSERCIGLVGMRGVGKTTIMLQQRLHNANSIYINCDSVLLANYDLFAIIKELFTTYTTTTFYLDEIHTLTDRSYTLKNIYDILPVSLVFSGSSMLALQTSAADLSRRAVMYTIPLLNYYEYLGLIHKQVIPSYTLSDIMTSYKDIYTHTVVYHSPTHRHNYLRYGQFPYMLESTDLTIYDSKLAQAIDKSIDIDINRLHTLRGDTTIFKKIFYLLSNSKPLELSYSQLAHQLSIHVKTVQSYIQTLQHLGRVHCIPKRGTITNIMRKEQKLYLSSTNVIGLFHNDMIQQEIFGMTREAFFVETVQRGGYQHHAMPYTIMTEHDADFCIEYGDKLWRYEIGGRNKKASSYASDVFIIRDNDDLIDNRHIPLRMFGFLR